MDINQFNKSFTESDWETSLSGFGWRHTGSKKFARPDKKGSNCSGSLQLKDGILFFKNFSSNSNLKKTSNGKDFYSPFEFYLTNICDGDKKRAFSELNLNLSLQSSYKVVSKTIKRKIIGLEHLQYEFDDSILQKQSIELETAFKFERWQADKEIIRKYPDAIRERVFRVAYNKTAINKNVQDNNQWHIWTKSFINDNYSLQMIFNLVGKGYSIFPGHLKNENLSKTKENFLYSELIFLDIERSELQPNIFSIKDFIELNPPGLVGIYTTTNHTEQEPRYRAIFELPFVIFNAIDYELLISNLIDKYRADVQCCDASRAYFGNNNAECYNFKNGQIFKYNNGELNENT